MLLPFLDTPPGLRDPADSAAWVLPVPYERTSSYRTGSGAAPYAILEASGQVETWDEELGAEPCRAGIATRPALAPPGGGVEQSVRALREGLAREFEAAPLLALLGGEHTITAPAVEAARSRFGELTVLQLDAHADLRDSYEGTPWNHACAMRRVLEHAPVVGVGIRSLSPEEAADLPRLPVTHFPAWECQEMGGWQERVLERLGGRVYLTVDLDALDPGLAPEVGTPEPGGLLWWPTLRLLRLVAREREVVGIDLVECTAAHGRSGTAFVAARLLHKAIAYVLEGRGLLG